MAQDGDGEDREEQRGGSSVNPSHDFDLVSLFSSQGVDAEGEADVIRGVLDSNGIPSLMLRAFGYPPMGFDVQVPRASLQEAERLVAEAQAAGPEAAAEAEAFSEES